MPPKDLILLRDRWSELWNLPVNKKIGSSLLRRSIEFKNSELNSHGLSPSDKRYLENQIKAYENKGTLYNPQPRKMSSGSRIVKVWRGKRYTVEVTNRGFEYNSKHYSSLSAIAKVITGTHWNGKRFFAV